jgi:hypothetical protein
MSATIKTSSPPAPIDPSKFSQMKYDMATLRESISQLMALYKSALTAASPMQESSPAPAPATIAPAASVSSALLSLFPTVEADIILAVIPHTFHVHELYKLNTHYCDCADKHFLSVTTSGEAIRLTHKSLPMLLVPLMMFISILGQHTAVTQSSATLHFHLLLYVTHLTRFAEEYEWAAVLKYHIEFHLRRRCEMLLGNFTGWSKIDCELMCIHLVGKCRNTVSMTEEAFQ